MNASDDRTYQKIEKSGKILKDIAARGHPQPGSFLELFLLAAPSPLSPLPAPAPACLPPPPSFSFATLFAKRNHHQQRVRSL